MPECSAEDVDRAVGAASRAFEKWFDSTPAERSLMLHRLADALEENAEELAQLESRNEGKPINAARGELPYDVDNLRFFAGVARDIEGKSAGEYARFSGPGKARARRGVSDRGQRRGWGRILRGAHARDRGRPGF